ncbi:hypothetical protein CW304_23900 [Bacillus sp. UFRGS-B20]|nr:hypothetical protein CW304_23900 [Bacillus sp. UFRGS-B20]
MLQQQPVLIGFRRFFNVAPASCVFCNKNTSVFYSYSSKVKSIPSRFKLIRATRSITLSFDIYLKK